MTDLTRRLLVAAGAATAATAATAAEQQPRELFGTIAGGKIGFPPLHQPSDAAGDVPNPDPPARRLGVAVVGLGHLALEQIIPAFGQARHVRLAGLVSGSRDKAGTIAAQHGLPASAIFDYESMDKLRDLEDVDIVYIVLPNGMHREFVERAAAAGKHVLCEKPMATSSADARAMVAACAQAKKRLMIAYRCQYEPHHRELIRIARAGELGTLRAIETTNGQNDADNGQWRQIRALAGGGSLPDVGLYCLNATRYLTGEEPVEITAQITRPANDHRFREVEDLASFTLRFPSGVLATCSSGYSHHESRHLRLMGSEAWAQLDPAFSYDGIALQIGRRAGKGNAVETRRMPSPNQFATEMDHFAMSIRDNRSPRTPGEEGVQDHVLMEAIYQAAEGGSAVRLPETVGIDITRGPEIVDEG